MNVSTKPKKARRARRSEVSSRDGDSALTGIQIKVAQRTAQALPSKPPKAGGRIWTVPPTRERKCPNPKPEIRGPKEGRNPKSDMPQRGFGLRYSAFFRVSALGFRI